MLVTSGFSPLVLFFRQWISFGVAFTLAFASTYEDVHGDTTQIIGASGFGDLDSMIVVFESDFEKPGSGVNIYYLRYEVVNYVLISNFKVVCILGSL